jgi:hypothetical protein
MFAITSGASPTAISEIFGRAELLCDGGGGSQLHRHRPDAQNRAPPAEPETIVSPVTTGSILIAKTAA